MSTGLRALLYGSTFSAIVFVLGPVVVLRLAGDLRMPAFGGAQAVGLAVGSAGAALAFACAVSFTTLGRGTPAPFDAPTRLVVRGPYRLVRNPMYVGAAGLLSGAALFFSSWALLVYLGALGVAAHLFVTRYEEPVLLRTFGVQYEEYCRRVGRWWPRGRRP